MEELTVLWHKPSNVIQAREYFYGYLTDEELNERQFSGRPWTLVSCANFAVLYIIIDDEYLVRVDTADGYYRESISMIKASSYLPMSLKQVLNKRGNTDER